MHRCVLVLRMDRHKGEKRSSFQASAFGEGGRRLGEHGLVKGRTFQGGGNGQEGRG